MATPRAHLQERRVNPIVRARRRSLPGIALLLLAAVLAFLPACSRYNELVDLQATVDQRWADVQAQLQRRQDLVPNLVAVVKGSAQHEEKTLTEVTRARAQAASIKLTGDDLSDPQKMAAFQQAQGQLSQALSRLMVVQERYPDLKANQAFHNLQIELEGTENRILRAREQYNGAVQQFNATINRVGGQIVNRVTGRHFEPRLFYNAGPGAETAPPVTF